MALHDALARSLAFAQSDIDTPRSCLEDPGLQAQDQWATALKATSALISDSGH